MTVDAEEEGRTFWISITLQDCNGIVGSTNSCFPSTLHASRHTVADKEGERELRERGKTEATGMMQGMGARKLQPNLSVQPPAFNNGFGLPAQNRGPGNGGLDLHEKEGHAR
eukprot:1197573-Rhodomonas_salina.4